MYMKVPHITVAENLLVILESPFYQRSLAYTMGMSLKIGEMPNSDIKIWIMFGPSYYVHVQARSSFLPLFSSLLQFVYIFSSFFFQFQFSLKFYNLGKVHGRKERRLN